MQKRTKQTPADVADHIDRLVSIELYRTRATVSGKAEQVIKGRLVDVGAIGDEITDVVVEIAPGVYDSILGSEISVISFDIRAELRRQALAAYK